MPSRPNFTRRCAQVGGLTISDAAAGNLVVAVPQVHPVAAVFNCPPRPGNCRSAHSAHNHDELHNLNPYLVAAAQHQPTLPTVPEEDEGYLMVNSNTGSAGNGMASNISYILRCKRI